VRVGPFKKPLEFAYEEEEACYLCSYGLAISVEATTR
jgi:hypothetical protein